MKKARPSKIDSRLSGVAGEYLVAAELSRRGYIASITLRNTRGVDILASNLDATRSVGIQVKTTQGSKTDWLANAKVERAVQDDLARNLFFVFVCLNHGGIPSFHVVPREAVAKYCRESHRKWLDTPGLKGQPHKDNSMRRFQDPDGKYKDRWDLLGLDSTSRDVS